jgi:hypothetical protein
MDLEIGMDVDKDMDMDMDMCMDSILYSSNTTLRFFQSVNLMSLFAHVTNLETNFQLKIRKNYTPVTNGSII